MTAKLPVAAEPRTAKVIEARDLVLSFGSTAVLFADEPTGSLDSVSGAKP